MIGMTVRYDEVLGPLREAYDARAAWRFTCIVIPSLSDPAGRILKVEGLSRAR